MEKILHEALKSIQKGQSCAFATLIGSTPKGTPRKAGAKMVVLQDGSIIGSVGGGPGEKKAQEECLKAIKTGKPKTLTIDYSGSKRIGICGGNLQIFIEPLIGTKTLVVCGAGHIGLPLSVLGKILGYKVIILDIRKNFANKTRFPHADKVITGSYGKSLAKIRIDPNTIVVIATHGHNHDLECLKAVITASSGYTGLIASKAKRTNFFNQLKKEGIAPNLLKKIHTPAGIDIGAQTPEEISISIIAEIIAKINKNRLGSEKFKLKKS